MAETFRLRRRRLARPKEALPSSTPLRALAANLSHVARIALAEPYLLKVEHTVIGLRRLPAELDGLRIVQLSDVHHSPFTSRAQVERAVQVANELKPDVIALTGDYVSHEP